MKFLQAFEHVCKFWPKPYKSLRVHTKSSQIHANSCKSFQFLTHFLSTYSAPNLSESLPMFADPGKFVPIHKHPYKSLPIVTDLCKSVQIVLNPRKSTHQNPCKSMQILTNPCKSIHIFTNPCKCLQNFKNASKS